MVHSNCNVCGALDAEEVALLPEQVNSLAYQRLLRVRGREAGQRCQHEFVCIACFMCYENKLPEICPGIYDRPYGAQVLGADGKYYVRIQGPLRRAFQASDDELVTVFNDPCIEAQKTLYATESIQRKCQLYCGEWDKPDMIPMTELKTPLCGEYRMSDFHRVGAKVCQHCNGKYERKEA